jgi:hypothetical protein
MIVILQQHIARQPHPKPSHHLLQQPHEMQPIPLLAIDRATFVAARGDMIPPACQVDP